MKPALAWVAKLFVSLADMSCAHTQIVVFVKCLDFAADCNKEFIVSPFLSPKNLTSRQRTLNLKELISLGTFQILASEFLITLV